MKEKLRSIFAVLILMLISFSSFYWWLVEIDRYNDFRSVIVFSWMSLSLIVVPVVFLFPIYWFFLLLLKGEDVAVKKTSKILPLIKIACIICLIIVCYSSFSYVSLLQDKGYISCKGVPSGWMPGMATKYVIDESLCHQKR